MVVVGLLAARGRRRGGRGVRAGGLLRPAGRRVRLLRECRGGEGQRQRQGQRHDGHHDDRGDRGRRRTAKEELRRMERDFAPGRAPLPLQAILRDRQNGHSYASGALVDGDGEDAEDDAHRQPPPTASRGSALYRPSVNSAVDSSRMAEPAYTRLHVDERRRQLLDEGARLFADPLVCRPLDGEDRPRGRHLEGAALPLLPEQAGLLRRHAPAGRRGDRAAHRARPRPASVRGARRQPRRLPRLDRGERGRLPPADGGRGQRAGGRRALVDGIRDATSARILDGIGAGDPPPPKLRAAVRAWLWFMDGAILDWLEHKDMSRAELRDLLLGSLAGLAQRGGRSP